MASVASVASGLASVAFGGRWFASPRAGAEGGERVVGHRELLVQEENRAASGHGDRGTERRSRAVGPGDGDARPGPAHGGGDQAGHLAGCAAALFFILIDDDPAEPGGDGLGGRGDQVVPAVPGQRDRGHRLAAPDVGDHAPGRVERRSVVAVVHDHRAAPGQVDVAPAGVGLFRGERGKRAPDVLTPAVHHEYAVVGPGHELLHDDRAALAGCLRVCLGRAVGGGDAHDHVRAVIACARLDHHRAAEGGNGRGSFLRTAGDRRAAAAGRCGRRPACGIPARSRRAPRPACPWRS